MQARSPEEAAGERFAELTSEVDLGDYNADRRLHRPEGDGNDPLGTSRER